MTCSEIRLPLQNINRRIARGCRGKNPVPPTKYTVCDTVK